MATDSGSGDREAVADVLRNWVMVVLTMVFVLLYGAALVGRLKPLTDVSVVTRLEPLIFVIIGYYFGRLPAQQNEKTLKDEVSRQTQRSDAAQHAKEQALQAREALEEKVRNVGAALASITPNSPRKSQVEQAGNACGTVKEDALRHSISAAMGILKS